MKTAIYIEDGVVQLVLTPENEFEQNALNSFKDKNIQTTIMHGQFYACQGGWFRHQNNPSSAENSLIIRVMNNDK